MSKLKEAVKEYVESFPWKRGSDYSQKYCHDAFIAGAQWQLQQLGHPDPPGEQGELSFIFDQFFPHTFQ